MRFCCFHIAANVKHELRVIKGLAFVWVLLTKFPTVARRCYVKYRNGGWSEFVLQAGHGHMRLMMYTLKMNLRLDVATNVVRV